MKFDKLYSYIFNLFYRYHIFSLFILTILIVFSIFRISSLKLTNDISLMLPENKSINNYFEFFRNSNISNKVAISFSSSNSEDVRLKDIINAVDEFSSKLDSPLINDVRSNLSSFSIDDLKNAFKIAPQLFDPKKKNKVKEKLRTSNVKKLLKEDYNQLLSPGGSFTSEFISVDPLNIYSDVLKNLKKMKNTIGYKLISKNNHLVSKDQKHVLAILDTQVNITNAKKSKRLIKYINKRLDEMPEGIEGNIVCGHLHTVSNEKIIKSDIRLTLAISAFAFILLFIFILKKDYKCFILLLIPAVSGLFSIALLSFFYERLSYFIIGMGGVITGIAIDYGIHVYVALKSSYKLDYMKKISKPIIIGSFTTIGIFLSFYFSDTAGYYQLASFAIVSILLSLFISLFILPNLLLSGFGIYNKKQSNVKNSISQKNNNDKELNIEFLNLINPNDKIKTSFKIRYIVFIIWGSIIGIFIFFASKQNISSDIKQFDGTSAKIIEGEKKFNKVWGNRNKNAILVQSSNTLRDLFSFSEEISQKSINKIGKENFTTFTSIWPSKNTRKKNIKRWNSFWRREKEYTKKLLNKYGPKYGFTKNAFKPFYESLEKNKITDFPEKNPIYRTLKKHFIYKRGDLFFMLSFFPDKKEYINKISKITEKSQNAFIVSRKNFTNTISKLLSREVFYLGIVSMILISLLSLLMFRNIFITIFTLIPVISSMISISAILHLVGIPLNVPVILAALIAAGLSIDYGVFMVYDTTTSVELNTFSAVTLSAITTTVGAGVVVFANHPLLYNIGLSLIIGVISGYLVSIFVLPSLLKNFRKNKR